MYTPLFLLVCACYYFVIYCNHYLLFTLIIVEIQQCMQFVGGSDTLLTVEYIQPVLGVYTLQCWVYIHTPVLGIYIHTPVLGIYTLQCWVYIHSSVGYIHTPMLGIYTLDLRRWMC